MTISGLAQWEHYVRRATARHGDKLDLGDIPRKFLPFFQTGQRIRVEMDGREITGTVSVTTGWRPALLLIRRATSTGSSDLLSESARIVAVQHGRTYVPVENLYRDPNRAS